ncbi:MAG TPA: class I SAM-dependent methyltransferase, partial [Umezawaea sp.]|nr:class I SAM-dependent methyltransferase [Umezawaea sp.]
MSLVASLHRRFAQTSRRQALAAAVAQLLPAGARTLDLGCGDGTLAELVLQARPDVRIVGVDPLARSCGLPFARCDGARLPFRAGAFDAVLLLDVVHHAASPRGLLG